MATTLIAYLGATEYFSLLTLPLPLLLPLKLLLLLVLLLLLLLGGSGGLSKLVNHGDDSGYYMGYKGYKYTY